MKLNKSLFFSFLLLVHTGLAISQGVFMDQASVKISGDALLTIQGSLVSENGASIHNEGEIYLRDNLENNGGNTLFSNEDAGTVHLYGNDQFVQGTDSTVFYNLYFDGDYLAKKELGISATVLNELDLNDQMLETRGHSMYLLNPSPTSLYFGDGFAASERLGGYLVRSTAATEDYIFPVGEPFLFPNIRPVVLTPVNDQPNTFGVRLSPYDVAVDVSGTSASGATGPFDINSKDSEVADLNSRFYHNIFRFGGTTPVTAEVFYANADGQFEIMTQWRDNVFANAGFSKENTGDFGLDVKMIHPELAIFDDDVFVLADLDIIINVPEGISPNGDGKNDVLYIRFLEYFPENELQIFNRWGDMVYKASPYLNDWDGDSNSSMKLGNKSVVAGTYYYILKLKDGAEPMKGFFELKR
jgi:gliding motility-associated-like protein